MEGSSSNSWILWRIQYSPEFKTEKLMHMNSLKKLENILGAYDLLSTYLSLFREGISPDIYDKRNNYAVKHRLVEEAHVDIFNVLWNTEIFRQPYINGINFKPTEISIWMNVQKNFNRPEDVPAKDRSNFYLDATSIFWEDSSIFHDSLRRPWTIGYAQEFRFQLAKSQDTVTSDDHLAYLLHNRYRLSGNGKCIILHSDMLKVEEWRNLNADNRFIFCSVKSDLKTANKLSNKFLLSVVLSIFPHIRIIYAAFSFYHDGYLKIGIYLTGKQCILLPNSRSIRAGPEDFAFTVAHKVKQIVLSELSPKADVEVIVTNAIPPENYDFANPVYRYKTERISLQRL